MTIKKISFWMFIRNSFLIIAVILLFWIILNQIVMELEQHRYPPLGQLVEVNGDKMHVYVKGEGEKTIVLLSGAGTAAPALDYEPLIKEMAKNNRIVVVETFGYGWSETTNKKRTVENIVEEIRTALYKANIKGPYILMPHSISGIYSLYYANKYPDEIKAIICNDCTLPQVVDYFNESIPTIPRYISVLASTGATRLAVYLNSAKYLPEAENGTYSLENLEKTKILSAWNLGNKNIIAEVNEINHNIDKTVNMSFPTDTPVLIFTKYSDRITTNGKTMEAFYQKQINHLSTKKLVVLRGHHYLHWSNFKEISKTVYDFINTF
ncbi:MAG: alpha/beta fold hydrolase [Bacillota bacterium]|uniref:alpha/beta fold hydrolase n=1 Tax=Virgibacillus TaxID=84406 RepID=UPI000413624A|nr:MULTISPECIES: alpha/beta hydrolase [Bacillaceae]MCC2251430.1 alpha/beta hydrolase [Virgibacillus sp. AGTR]WBX80287.1 alpha/beta hydrolase [Virgibacillus salarius]